MSYFTSMIALLRLNNAFAEGCEDVYGVSDGWVILYITIASLDQEESVTGRRPYP